VARPRIWRPGEGDGQMGRAVQTVQGRTDGHAAPRPSARSRCSRRRAGLGSREAEEKRGE
jgi:hypothetical protein